MVDLRRENQVVGSVGRVSHHNAVDGGCDHPGVGIETVDVRQRRILCHLVECLEQLAKTYVAYDIAVPGQEAPGESMVGRERQDEQIPGVVGRDWLLMYWRGDFGHDAYLPYRVEKRVKRPIMGAYIG